MIIWLYFSIVALLLAYCSKPNNFLNTNPLLFQTILSIWLAWFVSFGGKVMTDQLSYLSIYKDYGNSQLIDIGKMIELHFYSLLGSRNSYEVGYVFFNILFNKLGFDYVGFLFLFLLLTNLLLVKFIYRYNYPVFSVLILIGSSIFAQQANLVRQMFAVSVFLYSVKYIENRELWKYVFSIILASLIHVSSIILLPFYFIAYSSIPRIIMLLSWIASVYINYFQLQFSYLSSIKVNYYDMAIERIGRFEELRFDVIPNIFLGLFLLFSGNILAINKKYVLLINFFFIGVILSNISSLSFHFYRISLYFIIFLIVVVPNFHIYFHNLLSLNHTKSKYFTFVFYGVLILYFTNILLRKVYDESIIGLGTEMYSIDNIFK